MIGILPVNVMRKLFGPRGERHASARENRQWKAIRPWWFKIAETLHEMPFWAQVRAGERDGDVELSRSPQPSR